MIKSNLFIFSVCLGLLCLNTYAEINDSPFIIQSVRVQNMGGAFTAVADSEELFFFNPAGLQNIQDSRLTMFGIRASFNNDTVSGIREFAEAYQDADNSRELSLDSINKLQEYEPLMNLTAPIQITYIRQNFGFTLLNSNLNAKTNFSYTNNQSSVKVNNANDFVAMVSYGRQIYDGLSAGLSLKYLGRTEIRDTELADLIDENAQVSLRTGFGIDLGLMYELNIFPIKFGFAVRDIFNTNLSEQKIVLDSGDVKYTDSEYKVKRQTTFGISYQPDFKIPWTKLAYYPENIFFALDIGGGDTFSTVHFGTEIEVFKWLALRLGYDRGFRTGLGIQTVMFQLDYMFSPEMTDAYLNKATKNNHAFSISIIY